MKKLLLLSLLTVSSAMGLKAQLTVADTIPKFDLLQTLFGGGVVISNLQTFCDTTVAMWEFDGTNSNLGLNRGVLITSGEAQDAIPNGAPACTNLGTADLLTPGYAPLNALLTNGLTTEDACVITFDITPYCDTIGIRYVFGSEEYSDYVNANFNDIFAFFISGPGFGPAPGQNIALVPGTTQPVSIDNVNNGAVGGPCNVPMGPCTNCLFFDDNTTGATLGYDGFTTPLLAQAIVTACETYTVTLAIADVGDGLFDSGVFLEAGGIGCTSTVLALQATNNTALGSNVAVEDCVDGVFTFAIPAPLTDTVVFHYTIGGTATPGLDYTGLPDSIIMLPGTNFMTVPVTIVNDGLLEGAEYIEIIYTDSALCANSIYTDTARLQILDPPDLFQAPDEVLCADDTILVGVSTSIGQSYSWSPAVGVSNTAFSNPTLTLSNATSQPVTYDYILTTTAVQGFCEFRDTISVTVFPANQADFIADTVCLGVPTGFVDLTFADTLVSWTWDFGDGNVGTVQNPFHTYTQPGVFDVSLITLNASGCPDTIIKSVLVDSLPVVNYVVDTVCANSATQFSHIVGAGVSYDWEFGDGAVTTIASPNHIYPSFGNYSSQLVATTAQGCMDSSTVDVFVNQNPTAGFASPDICEGLVSTFSNTSQIGTGTSLSYSWDWDDNTFFGLTFEPSHTYANFGIYNVSLTVTDELGCSNTATNPVEIFAPVTANFNYNQICFGDSTPFTDISNFDISGPIVGWNWTFGDGAVANEQYPYHSYAAYGTYPVQLAIISEDGCVDTFEAPIEVFDQPIADFSFVSDCDEQAIEFTNLSSFNNSNVSYNWDFNDNSAASQQIDPSYVFSSFGIRTVSMTVSNSDGCNDTKQLDVEVWPLPNASFEPDPICAYEGFHLLDLSSVAPGRIQSHRWELGDGRANLPQAEPFVRYYVPGSYDIELLVTTEKGCADSITQTIDIYPLPYADFAFNRACTRDSLPFANLSTIADSFFNDVVADWTWDWGDGTQSGAIPKPKHPYQVAGEYIVSLTAVSDKGCTNTKTKPVQSWPLPAAPLLEEDSVCFSDGGLLLAVSSPPTERIDWFENAVGGEIIHTGNTWISPPVVFTKTYFVEPVTDRECRDGRYPITVFLRSATQGALMVSDSIVETPNALVNFQLAGTIQVAEAYWQFGDGNTSDAFAPSHQYQYPGRYEVSVKVIDTYGCESVLETVVEVKEFITLYVPSAFSPNDDGKNDELYIGYKLLTNFSFRVFNRWGQEVYTTDNPDFRWNGQDKNGQASGEGVYVYQARGVDIHGNLVEKSGTITIFR
ncbi:MAG: PKD domain-containing protein [Bacteroidia bacterium]